MKKAAIYWEFHKSTLLINWVFSAVIATVVSPWLFPVITMTGGPLLSLFYKELSRNKDYFFYYNLGITKVKLIAISMVFNVITGLLLLLIISQWQIPSK